MISFESAARRRHARASEVSAASGEPAPPTLSRVHGGLRCRGRMRTRAPLGEPRDFSFSIELPIENEAVRRLRSGPNRASVTLRRYGRRSAPVVLVLGAARDGRFIAGQEGWWSSVVRPGGGVDLNALTVFGADIGGLANIRPVPPASEAMLLFRALQQTRIPRLRALIGAGPGAAVALHLAALLGHQLGRLCLACPSFADEDAGLRSIAWHRIVADASVIGPQGLRSKIAAVWPNLRSLTAFHAVPTISGPDAYIYEAHLLETGVSAFMRA